MADEAMNPLRRRMIEDMKIRKLAPKTQHDDVQRVKNFAAFLGRSPDMASFEDVRRYQLHLGDERRWCTDHQPDRIDAAFLFQGHAHAPRYLPRPWTGMAQSPCRPCQPRAAEDDVGNRELPHGSRRPCRALRGLRLYDDCLQFLPQPALPEVPGRRREGMARRA